MAAVELALVASAFGFVWAAVHAERHGSVLARLGWGAGSDASTVVRPNVHVGRLLPILAGAVSGWFVWRVPGFLGGAVAAASVPWIRERRRSSSRARLLEDQLAEAVSSLAAAMRAGMSLPQAVRFAADEGEEPLAASFRHMADRVGLGVPLDQALMEWETAVGGADSRLLCGVLRLHRRTGGELPVVLDQVARTLSERRAAAREVHALTAQARLSGAILGFLPIGFFLFLSITSRDQIDAAFRTPAGIAAVAIGLCLQGLAFVWIRRLLRVA
jgi:tight adherence protein B